MGLELLDGPTRRSRLPLPDPDAAWASTDRSGRVLVTTRDGHAWLSAPVGSGRDPAWRELGTMIPGGRGSGAGVAFGSLSPDGRQAAFEVTRFDAGNPFAIAVVDLSADPDHSADPVRRLEIDRLPDGAPPAWSGEDLLVLTRERGDEPGISRVDAAHGTVVDGPGPAGGDWPPHGGGWTGRVDGLSVGADGSTVAVASGGGPIELHQTAWWLAGRLDATGTVPLARDVAGSTGFAWLALSPDGSRLAVVRIDDAGDASRVEVYAAEVRWGRAWVVGLPPAATRAVVAWLPDVP